MSRRATKSREELARHGGSLCQYATDAEPNGREGLELHEALAVWVEDPSLIYIEAGYFAAVGTHGRRPVVWGLGETEAEARSDANDNQVQAGVCSLVTVYPITEAQWATVAAGDVSWPPAPDCTKAHQDSKSSQKDGAP